MFVLYSKLDQYNNPVPCNLYRCETYDEAVSIAIKICEDVFGEHINNHYQGNNIYCHYGYNVAILMDEIYDKTI